MASEKLAYAHSNLRSFWKVNCYHLYSFPQRSRPWRLRSLQQLRVHSWILWQYLRVWLERRKWRSLKRGLRRSTTLNLMNCILCGWKWSRYLFKMISPQFRIPLQGTPYRIHHWLQTKSLFPASHQKPETRNPMHPRPPFWIVYLFTRVYQRVVNQQVKHPCQNIYLENNLFSICRKRRARKSRLS